MKEINRYDHIYMIKSVIWLRDWENFHLVEGMVDLDLDQLLYIFDVREQEEYFGASQGGKIYISDISWYLRIEGEIQLNDFIESGVPPYEALEFMEL